jgi:predicted MPP superfamily phosphohydrolase
MQFVLFVSFLGACIGHVSILVYSLNWWYAFALPKRFLRCLRALHGVLVVVGIAAFGRAYLADTWLRMEYSPDDYVGAGAELYQLACILIGLLLLPVITGRRLLRSPNVLLSNHTVTIDLAAKRGYKPAGRGKYRLLARLPGNEVFRIDKIERTVCLPRLPAAWEGLTIAHLSDLHFSGTPDRVFFQDVMDECRASEPDIVALTGDFVESDRYERWILPVLGRLRWKVGCYAVLGNHDLWHNPVRIRRRLERLGIHVLDNRWEQTEVRGIPLLVVGHEGPWFNPAPDLSLCPTGTFRLCLSHTPDNIRWARQHDVDLMLAGHNHGGQIRFPIVGSVLIPSRYGRRYDCGTFFEPPTVLHVSRGLGGEHPLRYNCRPEITKLVLRSAGETPQA